MPAVAIPTLAIALVVLDVAVILIAGVVTRRRIAASHGNRSKSEATAGNTTPQAERDTNARHKLAIDYAMKHGKPYRYGGLWPADGDRYGVEIDGQIYTDYWPPKSPPYTLDSVFALRNPCEVGFPQRFILGAGYLRSREFVGHVD